MLKLLKPHLVHNVSQLFYLIGEVIETAAIIVMVCSAGIVIWKEVVVEMSVEPRVIVKSLRKSL